MRKKRERWGGGICIWEASVFNLANVKGINTTELHSKHSEHKQRLNFQNNRARKIILKKQGLALHRKQFLKELTKSTETMLCRGKIVVEKRIVATGQPQEDMLVADSLNTDPVTEIDDEVQEKKKAFEEGQEKEIQECDQLLQEKRRLGMDRLEALLSQALADLCEARDMSGSAMDLTTADKVILRLESVMSLLDSMQESMMQVSRLLLLPEVRKLFFFLIFKFSNF